MRLLIHTGKESANKSIEWIIETTLVSQLLALPLALLQGSPALHVVRLELTEVLIVPIFETIP